MPTFNVENMGSLYGGSWKFRVMDVKDVNIEVHRKHISHQRGKTAAKRTGKRGACSRHGEQLRCFPPFLHLAGKR